ncbi:disease resistance-like protein DSC2 [Neltuma alba]|uniref:disease resistance-like protein DSC2 n=1 Tax=Neltuma alba TaxID=207710 RepID=UPI0010A38CBA|nr:disease resistance-like protein DSC2 [Prosopis alba]
MKSPASSSSSSHDSLYFSAILSPSRRENTHGVEDTYMESSSSAAAASASSSLFDPSSSTRENIHHQDYLKSSPPSSSSASSCSCSSSQPSSSNTSPITGENSHEVFISFRGEDTRYGFVSYLHEALETSHIRTYMDDRDLERGNEISSTLLRAIEQSKISLVVFSKNYASSSWTLDELVKIMNCKRTNGQIVLPIFYGISPSEVRKKRSYSNIFRNHNNLFRSNVKETKQRWENAMKEAADLAGWDSSSYKKESALLKDIVIDVKRKLDCMSHGNEGLSSQNCSPDDGPNSGGGSSHDDDDPTPEDSSPAACPSHGNLNLVGHLVDKIWDVLLRKENERLILQTRTPHQPSCLDSSRSYVYRNRYVPKQEHIWWGTRH